MRLAQRNTAPPVHPPTPHAESTSRGTVLALHRLLHPLHSLSPPSPRSLARWDPPSALGSALGPGRLALVAHAPRA
eukprot:3481352-Rhodomonas_salina.1